MKYKKLTSDQILISIDRLTRFKFTKEKYLRVYTDIILSCLTEPKIRKSELLNWDYKKIRDLATEIFNIMSKQSPAIFGKESIYRGPKCKNLGYCNEHKSCGLTMKYISPVKAIEEPKNKTWLQRLKDIVSS